MMQKRSLCRIFVSLIGEFYQKVYKNTGFDAILKAVLNDKGEIDYLVRKSGGADAN